MRQYCRTEKHIFAKNAHSRALMQIVCAYVIIPLRLILEFSVNAVTHNLPQKAVFFYHYRK